MQNETVKVLVDMGPVAQNDGEVIRVAVVEMTQAEFEKRDKNYCQPLPDDLEQVVYDSDTEFNELITFLVPYDSLKTYAEHASDECKALYSSGPDETVGEIDEFDLHMQGSHVFFKQLCDTIGTKYLWPTYV